MGWALAAGQFGLRALPTAATLWTSAGLLLIGLGLFAAKVARMPLNFASTGNLSGSTSNPHLEKPQASQFEVEVLFKPGV